MLLLEKTKTAQSSLAKYCKSGEYKNIEGVSKDRVKEYRRLVYNVIDDTLQSAFPLTFDLLTSEEWDTTVHSFFQNHNAQTPILWMLSKEFVDFFKSNCSTLNNKYHFLFELLLFEWLEIKLFMMEDIVSNYSTTGNLESDAIVLNPESHFQHFLYPVHYKKANEITEVDKGNYFLVMHREPEDGKILITKLSPFLLATLEILLEAPQNINNLLQQASIEFAIDIDESLKNGTYTFYQNILETKLILGFKH